MNYCDAILLDMGNIDLTALEIFKTVAEQGSITKAAIRLHRVQSNVTTRVKQLEERLGTKLFLRGNRRLVLSAAGQAFLGFADRVPQPSARGRGRASRRRAGRGVPDRGAGEHRGDSTPADSRPLSPELSGGAPRAGHG